MCSALSSHTGILKFQTIFTSFDKYNGADELFSSKWPWNWKSIQMISKLDETWHVVIISPTMYVVKFKDGYDKNRLYFVYKTGPFPSNHQGFYRKQSHYKYKILFLNDLNPKLFMCSQLSIHTNILKFQAFWTSFDKYYAFSTLFFSNTPMKLKVD